MPTPPTRPLRVRIDEVAPGLVQALAEGGFEIVEDDSADLHLSPAVPPDAVAPVPPPDSDPVVLGQGYRPDRPGGALTVRERQVLEHLGRGVPNSDIASSLYIAENTVKNHVRSILLKLDCRTRTQAVVAAHHLGLIVL